MYQRKYSDVTLELLIQRVLANCEYLKKWSDNYAKD